MKQILLDDIQNKDDLTDISTDQIQKQELHWLMTSCMIKDEDWSHMWAC